MSASQKPGGKNLGAIIGINMQLLFATGFGVAAYTSWPSDPHWWGFGVVSVLFGMGSAGCVINALREMNALYRKNKALAEYMAQGGTPKTAQLASTERLEQAGMLE